MILPRSTSQDTVYLAYVQTRVSVLLPLPWSMVLNVDMYEVTHLNLGFNHKDRGKKGSQKMSLTAIYSNYLIKAAIW